ncbi:hypothetical protein CC86DRAFT_408479 [Ophiobolus disseminans]|uniref:Integral membrane protein n=1 Tax=Ophiobolus disseminans TaxID=1469910 RepID=A0A6A6ZTK9_9PLEO|nr:hypothetical protein CC86DRAFT_408479 [Ophiobolus disseminans]
MASDYCAFLNATSYWQNATLPTPKLNPTERPRFFFTYQSSKITFSEWIWLLTLAFAPLLAHIFVGGPQIVILSPRKPSWLNIACLYNPTTIVWRYYSIAVRRATATNWSPYDAALANSAFWTGQSWDGSLGIAHDAGPSCIRMGKKGRVSLMSKSAAQTLIVALQGAQTVTDLAQNYKQGDSGEEVAVPTIFAFITLIGLYRLLVAPWLVDDFSFADYDSDTDPFASSTTLSETFYQDAKLPTTSEHPQNWRIWSLRILFFAPLTVQFILTLLLFVPFAGKGLIYTTTCTVLVTFTTYLAFSMLCITTWQLICKQDTHVVLPAVNCAWFQAYTLSIYAGFLALLVLASLETRRTFCGVYTTFPKGLDLDALLCKKISYI